MWTLIPSIYLQGQVEGLQQTPFLDIELLAQSKSKHIPEKFCWHGNLTEVYLNSLFGMMSPPSKKIIRKRLITSSGYDKGERDLLSQEDSLARTSVQPEKGLALLEQEAVYGKNLPESLAKYCPMACTWKTRRPSLLGDLVQSSVIFPKWGMTLNGELYPQLMSELNILENVSGYWATPTAVYGGTPDGEWRGTYFIKPNGKKAQTRLNNLVYMANKRDITMGTPTVKNAIRSKRFSEGRLPNPNEFARFSTPTTMDSLPPKSAEALHREATVTRKGRSQPSNLRDQISNGKNWPTPTCSDVYTGNLNSTQRKLGSMHSVTLPQPVAMDIFPTPSMTDYKGSPSIKRVLERADESSRGVRLPEEIVKRGDDGQLNPDWVEILMGWICGWTALTPLPKEAIENFKSQIKNNPWEGNWEQGVPRVSKNTPFRADRLKAIGNGQVSLCAATAFKILLARSKYNYIK